MNSDDKFAIAIVTIACVTAIGLTCMLVSCGNDVNAAIEADQKAAQTIEHANGCPLDAVAYDAPAFANVGSKSYKVTDRFGGASWWLVKMGRSWVVLPIESKEAVDVG